MDTLSSDNCGAFVARFLLPATGEGRLNGLRFAVKDVIDVAGHRTGCGNPTRLEAHPPANVSAPCVDQLLAAGAVCEGKTITDELALSLLGENYFYGTPLNPAAPDRVPGGSSSGSASAVACGLVDFALGTDTGGSVRVPASNCGVWGWRPTHGSISLDGVMPLAPSFDTVGVLARSTDILLDVAHVLLAPTIWGGNPRTIHLVVEAFALADPEVREALEGPVELLKETFGDGVHETSLAEICHDSQAADLSTWLECYRVLMGIEAGAKLRDWIDDPHPQVGPAAAAGLKFLRGVRDLKSQRIMAVGTRREHYCNQLFGTLGGNILCFPTTPTIAPLKGETSYDRGGDYYERTLSLTSIAGVSRLPQVSMPLGAVSGSPIGLSIACGEGDDMFLLDAARMIDQRWRTRCG
jgi:amidase